MNSEPDSTASGADGTNASATDDGSTTDDGSATGGGSDTYTHVPEGMDPAGTGADAPDDMGARGWVLVGVVVLATLVLPTVVYLYPAVLSDYVSFRFAMLAVPFLPALLLGGAAVWAMAARR